MTKGGLLIDKKPGHAMAAMLALVIASEQALLDNDQVDTESRLIGNHGSTR